MLSYRHAFHAGNHADVLKHLVLVQLLAYLTQKDKPLWVIDTHAGAGGYALDTGYATRLAESADGVGRLWGRTDVPPAVAEYLALVRRLNGDGPLRQYPGSPLIAHWGLRAQDRLRLFELHPADVRLLAERFEHTGRGVLIAPADGFDGIKTLLPPPSRRGLVLIDPSYEQKSDYGRVVAALKDGLARFATGTYAVWYPELARLDARELPGRLKRLPCANWLHVALSVRGPAGSGAGMTGSGMFVINPPWTLEAALRETMPWLTDALAQDAGARFVLESGSGGPAAAREAPAGRGPGRPAPRPRPPRPRG